MSDDRRRPSGDTSKPSNASPEPSQAPQKRILRNRARCLECGDVVESKTRHDFKTCSCGNLSVDGGHDYLKRSAREFTEVEDLSEWA